MDGGSEMDLNELFNGLVLRALTCKRCGQVCPVAVDEIESMKGLMVIHKKGGAHSIEDEYGSKVSIWQVLDGRVSVPMENDSIVRISKYELGMPGHAATLGYVKKADLPGDQAPYSGGTAEQFMAMYAWDSGVEVDVLREHGRTPVYVSQCSEYDFPHWEMGRVSDDAIDRRNQIEAPA